MTKSRYDTVIFDLNGIFLTSEFLSKRVARDFGVSQEVFVPKLQEIMTAARQPGAEPTFTHWEPALRKWGITLSESEFWEYWFGGEKQNEAIIELARQLRHSGAKVFVLSNNFRERSRYYGQYPWIHDAVDKVYFSWQTGFVKPDPRAWQNLLTEQNLTASQVVYFDDSPKNVEAAAALGIESRLYESPDQVQRTLIG